MKIGLRTPLFIVVIAPTASISRTPSDNLAQSRVFRRSAIRMPVRWPPSPNSVRGRCARTGIRAGGKDANPWNRHKRRRRAHVARGQFPDQSAALLPALRLGASVARSTITGGHRKERWLTGRCNVDRRRSVLEPQTTTLGELPGLGERRSVIHASRPPALGRVDQVAVPQRR